MAVKVGVCCTFGVGSSMILKMNLETAFAKLGVDAEVEVSDIANVNNGNFEIIFTGGSLAEQVRSMSTGNTKVMPINDYFNTNELETAIKKALGGE